MNTVSTAHSRTAKLLSASPVEASDQEYFAFYSDAERYRPDDVFMEELVDVFEQSVRRNIIRKRITASITVLAIVSFLLSGLLLIFGVDAPPYDGSAKSVTAMVLYALHQWFGWSKILTGNEYTVSTIVTLVVALFSQARLSALLLHESFVHASNIEELRTNTKGSKQIYPGSGRLRFSYGKPGLLVSGGNVRMSIKWDAVSWLLLIHKGEKKEKGKLSIKKVRDVTFVGDDLGLSEEAIEASTHLLIYLGRTVGRTTDVDSKNPKLDAAEFLVVPKWFFDNERDARPWVHFVKNLIPYKQRHNERTHQLADS